MVKVRQRALVVSLTHLIEPIILTLSLTLTLNLTLTLTLTPTFCYQLPFPTVLILMKGPLINIAVRKDLHP
jgi:hypothetical protein